jgi:hypothetical protein
MSDTPFVIPPKFKYAFSRGEHVHARDFGRFEPYLARQPEETDSEYAARLNRVGLAVVVTTEDVRDLAEYRARIGDAESRGVPLALLPIERTAPVFDEATREAQKAAALAAARESQT